MHACDPIQVSIYKVKRGPCSVIIFRLLFKETLNKARPALLADLNLIGETTLHDFAAQLSLQGS